MDNVNSKPDRTHLTGTLWERLIRIFEDGFKIFFVSVVNKRFNSLDLRKNNLHTFIIICLYW